MKMTLSDIAEEQGRAYARALVDAERIRAMSLEEFAMSHDFPDPEQPGQTWRWHPNKPAWYRTYQGSEGPVWGNDLPMFGGNLIVDGPGMLISRRQKAAVR